MPDPSPHASAPGDPGLLHPQERDRMLAALRGMLRRLTLNGRAVTGLAAEASPGAPLRALDNAVAAAALALPELRAADPVLAAAPLGFLGALVEAGEEGGLPRAVAAPMPRVAIRRADPADIRVETPWHVLTGDLTRGVLVQSLRGEDEARAVRHTGNLVRLWPAGPRGLPFRLGLKVPVMDVEDGVTEAGAVQEGRDALLFHEGPLRVWGGRAGRIRYEYRVSADDPVLRIAVILRAPPGFGFRSARVTTALDALSGVRPPMRGAAVTPPGGAPAPATGRDGFEGEWEGLSDLADPRAVEILHVWAPGHGGADPLSIHLRPREPARLQSVRAQAGERRDLHWVVLRHDLGAVPAGGTARVEEGRLLLRGRLPEVLTRAAVRLRDPGAAEAGLTAHPLLLAALADAIALAPAEAAAPRLRSWLRAAVDRALREPGPLHPATALAAEVLDHARSGREAWRPEEIAARLDAAGDGTSLLVTTRLARHSPALAAALRDSPFLRAPDPGELEGMPTWDLATRLRAFRAAEGTGLVPSEVTGPAIAACLDALSARLRPRDDALEVAPDAGAEGGDALSTAATLLALLAPEGPPPDGAAGSPPSGVARATHPWPAG